MNADLTPRTADSRHPLEHIADARTRLSVARLLAAHCDGILTEGRTELARRESLPARPCPPDLLPAVLAAFVDLLQAGTLDGLDAVFARAVESSDPALTLFDAAACVRHALGAVAEAAFPAVLAASPEGEERERGLALLLAATNEGGARLYNALARTVLREITAERERQMQFYQEIVRLATNNRLRLAQPHEVPAPHGQPIVVRTPLDASRLRHAALQEAAKTGMASARAEDFALAVGEAASNVLKHATGGTAHAWATKDAVFAFLADTGHGITLDMLPKALSPGWSSIPSLGMGFTLMLEMADVLWLSTNANGTLLCIQQNVAPREDPSLHGLALEDFAAIA